MNIEINLVKLLGDDQRDHQAFMTIAASFSILVANAKVSQSISEERDSGAAPEIVNTDEAYFFRLAAAHLHEVAEKLDHFQSNARHREFWNQLSQLNNFSAVNRLLRDSDLRDFLMECRQRTFHAGFRGEQPRAVTVFFGEQQNNGSTRFLTPESAVKEGVKSTLALSEDAWSDCVRRTSELRSAVIRLVGEFLQKLYESDPTSFSLAR